MARPSTVYTSVIYYVVKLELIFDPCKIKMFHLLRSEFFKGLNVRNFLRVFSCINNFYTLGNLLRSDKLSKRNKMYNGVNDNKFAALNQIIQRRILNNFQCTIIHVHMVQVFDQFQIILLVSKGSQQYQSSF